MTIKLFVFPPSPRSFKVLCVANHLGIDYELRVVDLTRGEQTGPEVAGLNPNRKVPTLEDDGLALWESNAIIQYLASKQPEAGLLPADERARADISRWQFWESTTFDPACAILVFERFVKAAFGRGAPEPAEVEKGLARFHQAAAVLNGHLLGKPFVCGNLLTLADFSIGAGLTMSIPAQFPLDPYPEIRRWYGTLSELQAWKKTLSQGQPPPA